MTKQEMIAAYTKAFQNQLSSSAEKRMQELEAEADQMGLRFEMRNRTAYMMPHYLGTPEFELIQK